MNNSYSFVFAFGAFCFFFFRPTDLRTKQERGFESMMEAEKFDELRRMYTLFLQASADGDGSVCEVGDRSAPRTTTSARGSSSSNRRSPKQRSSGNDDDNGEGDGGQGRLILDLMNAYGSYVVKKGLQVCLCKSAFSPPSATTSSAHVHVHRLTVWLAGGWLYELGCCCCYCCDFFWGQPRRRRDGKDCR